MRVLGRGVEERPPSVPSAVSEPRLETEEAVCCGVLGRTLTGVCECRSWGGLSRLEEGAGAGGGGGEWPLLGRKAAADW